MSAYLRDVLETRSNVTVTSWRRCHVMDDLDNYRAHLVAHGFSPATVRARVDVVAMIARDAGCKPAELEPADVEGYFGRRPHLAVRSRQQYRVSVRMFAQWAGLPDPTESMPALRVPPATPRPISEADLAVLLAAARGLERPWLLAGAFAGCRSFETAKLRGEDLLETPTGASLRIRGKGGRDDVVPVPGVLADELAWWRRREGNGRLWPSATAQVVRNGIKRLADRAGLHGVTSHRLRHRYGTAVYAASRGDLLLTQRLMRHSSPRTTAGYAATADGRAARVVSTLPGARRF